MQSLHLSLEDIVKIPELVEHFQEHQEKYGDSYIDFINKHYGAEKNHHNSEDNEDHQDLPFHHSSHFCIDLKVDLPQLKTIAQKFESATLKHYFVYQPPHTASAAHSLFHPPKHNC
jgi:hypothetical protein